MTFTFGIKCMLIHWSVIETTNIHPRKEIPPTYLYICFVSTNSCRFLLLGTEPRMQLCAWSHVRTPVYIYSELQTISITAVSFVIQISHLPSYLFLVFFQPVFYLEATHLVPVFCVRDPSQMTNLQTLLKETWGSTEEGHRVGLAAIFPVITLKIFRKVIHAN